MPKKDSIKYLAFLRGINVGGHRIKMTDLKKAFEDLGTRNVKTLIASGNVYFESDESERSVLRKNIEETLEETFGFAVPTILRTQKEIYELSFSDPFKHIEITKNTRLYITFLNEKHKSELKIPYKAPAMDYTILNVSEGEVVSVLELNPESRTVDSMKILEKEFGKNVTTRNWNTVKKMAEL